MARLCVPVLLAILLGFSASLAAQTPSTPPSSATQSTFPRHKPMPHHVHPTAAHPADPLPISTPALPQPEAPKWPVNAKADPASVVWDSHGLRIDATNSSLEQILTDVSTETGAKVEGLDADQRIFGTFGPGTARDVLGQLLEGSGYNFLMIGDQGQGTPREIVLSTRSLANPQAAKTPTPSDEDEVDEQPQQPQQPQQPEGNPIRPGFPPRTPMDMQQREQQLRLQQQQQQQQQQGQQPGQPPPTPPNQ